MNTQLSYVLSLLSCIVVLTRAQEEHKPVNVLPADIPTCRQDDLNLNECLRGLLQSMTPRIKDGIKELNIPPFDPYLIEKSTYQFNTPLVQGRVAVRNVRVHGMSDTIYDKVKIDIKDKRVRTDVTSHVPHMLIEGAYKSEMRINEIKLTPKGYFNVSMNDIRNRALSEGEVYERDNHTYLRLTNFNSEPEVGDMRVYASGIFPDPTMNDLILDFVNQYWQQIYKSVLPETRSTWEPFILNTTNDFLSTLPIDLVLTKN